MVKPLRHTCARVLALTCLLACAPAVAHGAEASNGGASPTDARYRPAAKAKIVNGYAIPPRNAPPEVAAAIEAGNRIIRKPYRYGGGHGDFDDSGYDCSGAVSYALHGGDWLDRPLDSSGLMSWGESGEGEWVTVYAKGSHAYVIIAGLRFDTSGAGEEGPRWREERASTAGYAVRHPEGF